MQTNDIMTSVLACLDNGRMKDANNANQAQLPVDEPSVWDTHIMYNYEFWRKIS